MTDELKAVSQKGEKAYWDGASRINGNPYSNDTAEFKAWDEGWGSAQQQKWAAAK